MLSSDILFFHLVTFAVFIQQSLVWLFVEFKRDLSLNSVFQEDASDHRLCLRKRGWKATWKEENIPWLAICSPMDARQSTFFRVKFGGCSRYFEGSVLLFLFHVVHCFYK
jgi:hypothetical protein